MLSLSDMDLVAIARATSVLVLKDLLRGSDSSTPSNSMTSVGRI
jgi:hypothetical protein